MSDYYNFHIKRMEKTLNLIPNKYIINNVLNIGYSDFDYYLKEYFKNSSITYLIPENTYIENINKKNYILGNICDPKFNVENKYNLVIFTEVLEHLLQDNEIILLNLKKLVAKNGLLLMSVPNGLQLSNRIKVVLGNNIYWSKKEIVNGVYGGFGHIREYSLNEIRDLVSNYFKIIEIKGINGYRKGAKKILNMLPITYCNTIAVLGENYE